MVKRYQACTVCPKGSHGFKAIEIIRFSKKYDDVLPSANSSFLLVK